MSHLPLFMVIKVKVVAVAILMVIVLGIGFTCLALWQFVKTDGGTRS